MKMFRRAAWFALSLVAVMAAGLPAGRVAAAESFVEGFDELPLMPGLVPVKGEALSFDKQPVGRIVQGTARGPLAAESVRKFYRDTMPQLGWRPLPGGNRFVRDGEMLHIDILPAPADKHGRAQVSVRFSMSPE